MKLGEKLKREIVEVVAMSFETGHFSFDNKEDFKRDFREFENFDSNAVDEAWEYYCELVNLGPAGFYEEFKDDYDFDPMFVEEYGDPDCEEEILIDRLYHDASEDELRAMGCFGDEEEEEYKFVVRFDVDGQNMDCWCEDEEFAVEYAKKHLDCGPTIYQINEETGIEEFYMDINGLEEEDD